MSSDDTVRIAVALNSSTILPLVCPGLSFRPCVLYVPVLCIIIAVFGIDFCCRSLGWEGKGANSSSFSHSTETATTKIPVSSENSNCGLEQYMYCKATL